MKPKEERKLSTLRGMTIIFRPKLCVLCRSCELACAVSKSKSKNLFTAINEKPIPQQRLYITKTADEGIVSQQRCEHCETAPCVAACSLGAIERDPISLSILIDTEKCIACMFCVDACEKKVLKILKIENEAPVVLKCTHCVEIPTGPECVRSCPTKALVVSLASKFVLTHSND